jgi:hypothetical protein
MLTIADVRSAIEQGDKPRAVQMLQIILTENPSADAWYVAARLTHDNKTAVRYLRRALMIDPDHRRAAMMLEKMGEQQQGVGGHVLDEIIDMLHEQANKSILLKRLNPRQQLIALGVMALVIVVGFVISISSLLNAMSSASETLYVPEVAPRAERVMDLNVNMVADHLVANGYELANLTITGRAGTTRGETLSFSILATSGNYAITIRVYEDLSALIGDREDIGYQEAVANVITEDNAVLIYPRTLPKTEAQRLITVFNALTGDG